MTDPGIGDRTVQQGPVRQKQMTIREVVGAEELAANWLSHYSP